MGHQASRHMLSHRLRQHFDQATSTNLSTLGRTDCLSKVMTTRAHIGEAVAAERFSGRLRMSHASSFF